MLILKLKVSGDMLGDLHDEFFFLNSLSHHRNPRSKEGLTCLS